MKYAVDLIKREYHGDSAVKMHVNDHRGKLLMYVAFPLSRCIPIQAPI